MKKHTLLFLVLILLLTLCACGSSQGKVPAEEPGEQTGEPVEENSQKVFTATVLETGEGYILVEPLEGEAERSSSDKITVATGEVMAAPGAPELKVGDTVRIDYDGNIAESYPAQIGKVYSITLEVQTSPVEYSGPSGSMSLELPEGWDYEIVEPDDTVEFGGSGICFWPTGEPDMKLSLLCYPGPLGMCGTGVTIEDVSFSNGLTATSYTETLGDDSFWMTLIYKDKDGVYAMECRASTELWETYQARAQAIFESVRLDLDEMPETENAGAVTE